MVAETFLVAWRRLDVVPDGRRGAVGWLTPSRAAPWPTSAAARVAGARWASGCATSSPARCPTTPARSGACRARGAWPARARDREVSSSPPTRSVEPRADLGGARLSAVAARTRSSRARRRLAAPSTTRPGGAAHRGGHAALTIPSRCARPEHPVEPPPGAVVNERPPSCATSPTTTSPGLPLATGRRDLLEEVLLTEPAGWSVGGEEAGPAPGGRGPRGSRARRPRWAPSPATALVAQRPGGLGGHRTPARGAGAARRPGVAPGVVGGGGRDVPRRRTHPGDQRLPRGAGASRPPTCPTWAPRRPPPCSAATRRSSPTARATTWRCGPGGLHLRHGAARARRRRASTRCWHPPGAGPGLAHPHGGGPADRRRAAARWQDGHVLLDDLDRHLLGRDPEQSTAVTVLRGVAAAGCATGRAPYGADDDWARDAAVAAVDSCRRAPAAAAAAGTPAPARSATCSPDAVGHGSGGLCERCQAIQGG